MLHLSLEDKNCSAILSPRLRFLSSAPCTLQYGMEWISCTLTSPLRGNCSTLVSCLTFVFSALQSEIALDFSACCDSPGLASQNSFLITSRLLWGYYISHSLRNGIRCSVNPFDITQRIVSTPALFKLSFGVRSLKHQEIIENEWRFCEESNTLLECVQRDVYKVWFCTSSITANANQCIRSCSKCWPPRSKSKGDR